MTAKLAIFVCDTEAKAVEARQFLRVHEYNDDQISDESVKVFTYDAQTYDGGTSDSLANKIVVIGRKES